MIRIDFLIYVNNYVTNQSLLLGQFTNKNKILVLLCKDYIKQTLTSTCANKYINTLLTYYVTIFSLYCCGEELSLQKRVYLCCYNNLRQYLKGC